MNVFAKSRAEAYQLALNKLEVRRLNGTGDYTSVPPGPKDGSGMATVTDLKCRQLPIQVGKTADKNLTGEQILGVKNNQSSSSPASVGGEVPNQQESAITR
jgi:hypothetical protein